MENKSKTVTIRLKIKDYVAIWNKAVKKDMIIGSYMREVALKDSSELPKTDDKAVKDLQAKVKALETANKKLTTDLAKKPKTVTKTVTDDKAVKDLQAKVKALETANKKLTTDLAKKPKTVTKTVTDDKAVKDLQAKVKALETANKKLATDLAKKPKTVTKTVTDDKAVKVLQAKVKALEENRKLDEARIKKGNEILVKNWIKPDGEAASIIKPKKFYVI